MISCPNQLWRGGEESGGKMEMMKMWNILSNGTYKLPSLLIEKKEEKRKERK